MKTNGNAVENLTDEALLTCFAIISQTWSNIHPHAVVDEHVHNLYEEYVVEIDRRGIQPPC